jgi:hypothetical protein
MLWNHRYIDSCVPTGYYCHICDLFPSLSPLNCEIELNNSTFQVKNFILNLYVSLAGISTDKCGIWCSDSAVAEGSGLATTCGLVPSDCWTVTMKAL